MVTEPRQLIRFDLRVNGLADHDIVVTDCVCQFGKLRLQEFHIRPEVLLWSSLQIRVLLRDIVLERLEGRRHGCLVVEESVFAGRVIVFHINCPLLSYKQRRSSCLTAHTA